jgi:hypothetical protein
MNDRLDNPLYAGTWILAPELCLYQEGEPPTRGTYTIVQRGAAVEVSIDWTARDGGSHTISFGGPVDGSPQPIAGQPGTELVFAAISPQVLDSTVKSGARVLAYARRCASSDGQLLSTVQEGHRADGSAYRNFQVYRRQARVAESDS